MLKALIKRLFLALFTDELKALKVELRAQIERTTEEVASNLTNDHKFTYDLSQMIINQEDVILEHLSEAQDTLESLQGRIDDLEESMNNASIEAYIQY